MNCKFGGTKDRESNLINIGNDLVSHSDESRYLGSMVKSHGEFNLNITNRMVVE